MTKFPLPPQPGPTKIPPEIIFLVVFFFIRYLKTSKEDVHGMPNIKAGCVIIQGVMLS